MKITDIEWDASRSDIEECNLPSEIDIPDTVILDDIADYISDNYGFCIKGFAVEVEGEDKYGGIFTLYEDMTDIVDSVQLESDDTNGIDVCSYQKDSFLVTIEVRGAVKIWWNTTTNNLNNGEGMYYTHWSEFPEELKNLIRNTGTADRHWTCDPRVYVSENNWFEIFLWEKDGKGGLNLISSDCIDIEGENADKLKVDCTQFLNTYLRQSA